MDSAMRFAELLVTELKRLIRGEQGQRPPDETAASTTMTISDNITITEAKKQT